MFNSQRKNMRFKYFSGGEAWVDIGEAVEDKGGQPQPQARAPFARGGLGGADIGDRACRARKPRGGCWGLGLGWGWGWAGGGGGR